MVDPKYIYMYVDLHNFTVGYLFDFWLVMFGWLLEFWSLSFDGESEAQACMFHVAKKVLRRLRRCYNSSSVSISKVRNGSVSNGYTYIPAVQNNPHYVFRVEVKKQRGKNTALSYTSFRLELV